MRLDAKWVTAHPNEGTLFLLLGFNRRTLTGRWQKGTTVEPVFFASCA